MPITQNLDQSARVTPGDIRAGRNVQHPRNGLSMATTNSYLIAGFDGMRGLCRPVIKQNNARVTELLSYCAARAEAAQLQK